MFEEKSQQFEDDQQENMLTFTSGKLSGELAERAPTFHSVLVAASANLKSQAKEPTNEFAEVAIAGDVCLCNRSRYMIAAQLLVTTFCYYTSWVMSHS